jgi:hypothetical protein
MGGLRLWKVLYVEFVHSSTLGKGALSVLYSNSLAVEGE